MEVALASFRPKPRLRVLPLPSLHTHASPPDNDDIHLNNHLATLTHPPLLRVLVSTHSCTCLVGLCSESRTPCFHQPYFLGLAHTWHLGASHVCIAQYTHNHLSFSSTTLLPAFSPFDGETVGILVPL